MKPRDYKAEAARRNERAQAAGYTNYSQQYRAQKAGYRKEEGRQFTAAKARRGTPPTSPAVVMATPAGTIIAGQNARAVLDAIRQNRRPT